MPFAVTCPLLSPALCCTGFKAALSTPPGVNAELFTPQLPAFLFCCFQRSVSPVFLFTFPFPCTPLQPVTNIAPAGCSSSSSSAAPTRGCPSHCSSAGSPGSRRLQGSPAPPLVLGSFVPDDPAVCPAWLLRVRAHQARQRLGAVPQVPQCPVSSQAPSPKQGLCHTGPGATLCAWLVRQCCWAAQQQLRDQTPSSHRYRCSPQLLSCATQISVAGGDFLSFR